MVRKGFAKLFHYLNLAADVLAVTVALTAAYFLRFSGWPVPLMHEAPLPALYLQALPVVLLIILICYQYAGLYLQRRGISGVDEFSGILRGASAGFILIVVVTFFYRRDMYSRVVFFYAWAFTVLLTALARSLLRRLQVSLRRQGKGVSRLALVGLTESGRQVAEQVRRYPGLGYKLIGFVSGKKSSARQWEGARILGSLDALEKIIAAEQIDEVIIALPAAEHKRIETLLLAAASTGVSFKIVSDLFGIITKPLNVDDIYGIPVFALQESPLSRLSARFLKRALDLVFTLPALLLLSPLFALIAAAVKFSSPGPVFFRQERVGRDNQPFLVFKFRTMRQDAEAQTGPVWARRDDPRRTAAGAFLRRSSLDELPQLFNVLIGNMSLVGPRPERPHFVKQFQDTVPRYLERHRVKSGLTGWAQVHGLRGNTPIGERTKYDLWYVENWSLVLDVKILLRTALEVFHHKEAY